LDAALRILFAVLFGLAVGSFLTVAVYRVPRKESVVAPRSRCPACGAEIRPRDNIPVLSYLLLRGRCRACGARISARYLFLEVATAALFAGAALRFDATYTAALLALFFAVMLAIAVIDAERRIVPNRIVYPSLVAFGVLVCIGALVGDHLDLAGAGVGLLAYGGGLLLVAIVAPGGMGMGDVKLAALIGLVLGALGLRYVAVAAAVAIFAGGVGAIALLVFTRASRKQAIPFGPYLAAGAVVAAFLAPRIASWYTALAR
jgi:leader peptidase (prepilin peptidase) / N-methyltransferase